MTAVMVATVMRPATVDDVEGLQRLLERLAVNSRYTGGAILNATHLRAMLDRLLANPDAGFLVAEMDDALVGLLVVLLFEDLISGDRKAAEICWYVDPACRYGLGLHLLTAGEQWARAHGARCLQMLSPDVKFDVMFSRRGYALTNRVFERRL